MTIPRGSPTLTYTKQSDGYICHQRTRIEKPSASDHIKFVSKLILVTLCLAAFLHFTSMGQLMSPSHHHHHGHHHPNGANGGFLRNEGKRIVDFAASAFDDANAILHEYIRKDENADDGAAPEPMKERSIEQKEGIDEE